MYHYLHISLPDSVGTVKEPHLYLNAIARPDYIDLLEEYFFEEHKSAGSIYASALIDLNRELKQLIFHYEVEGEYDELKMPAREWKYKVVNFADSLLSTLRIEYLEFCRNLDAHFTKDSTIKSKSAFIKQLLGRISERYQRVESMSPHQPYLHHFKRFFSRLCTVIKRDYYAYLPKNVDSTVSALLNAELDGEPIDLPSLHVDVYNDIMDLKDERGRSIFRILRPERVFADFKHLIYNQPGRMMGPIIVRSAFNHTSAARYLIDRLCHYAGVSAFDDSGASLFILNDSPLTDKSTYTAKSRIRKKYPELQKRLDDLIKSHIY